MDRTERRPVEPTTQKALENEGFAVVPRMLSDAEVDRLRTLIDTESNRLAAARRAGRTYGARNLLAIPAIAALARTPAVRGLTEPIVGTDAIAVRALFFDKTPEANWPVLWHQDLTIAVAERHDMPGWGPWSTKAGITHVEPPAARLATMLAIRLHLDDCQADNGPLRVIPGSHRKGRLTRDEIKAERGSSTEQALVTDKGSAILMRPLLLHASSPATNPNHRRVIHIEYAPRNGLPPPLKWASEQTAVSVCGLHQ
jgi:ectoine hydroxylase-related dioxygenase (phytanoyl-CoA dioxygenase family)